MTQLLLSALLSGGFAGLAAVSTTVLIERCGGVVGGILGTMPTTVVPASIGIAYNGERSEFGRAMFTVATAMLINTGFLYSWKVIPKYLPKRFSQNIRLFLMMLPISLLLWFTCAVVFVFSVEVHISIYWIGASAAVLQLLFGVFALFLQPTPAPKGAKKVGWPTYLARACLASSFIFGSVYLSRLNGVASGLAASFPAIYTTTMISLWYSQGEAVTTGAVGPMMLGGLAVSAYAMSFYLLFQKISYYGVPVAYAIAVICVSMPVLALVRKCQKVPKENPVVEESNENKEEKTEITDEIKLVQLEEEEITENK